MKPEFPSRKTVGQENRADWHVDEIGKNCPEKQKADINFRISENPPKQPEVGPEVPEEHWSGDENASAVDTTWQIVRKSLLLFGW